MTRLTNSLRWDTLTLVLKACALAMFLFHIAVFIRMPLEITYQQVVHLTFAFILIFGFGLRKDKPLRNLLCLSFLLASLVALAYIAINKDALEWRAGIPTQTDVVIGIILIISVFFASYKGWGPILPVVVLLSVLYALFGSFLPGAIAAPHAKFSYTISILSTSLSGIFGALLTVSLLYVFLFVIFGEVLSTSGAATLIKEGGKWLSKRVISGGALTATIGSALVGTCTGSATANVFMTGSFTIPMMKKQGLKPEFAAAVEALASTGGQIMPPVLGAAGFVMAYYIGVHYFEVVKMAWIPAFLYFISCGFGAHFYCKTQSLKPLVEEQEKLNIIFRKGTIFLVGIAVLMVLLLLRYSASFAAGVSIVVILAAIFLEGLFTHQLRAAVRSVYDSIAKGARIGSDISMAMALLGMLAQVFTDTGLGYKLGIVMVDFAGENILLGLVMIAILILILGTGLPTTPAYLVAAIVAAPPLIRLGLEPRVVHFFILYYAVFALVTPPVAASAMAAAKLAGTSFMRTAIAATRLAAPIFFIPFLFVYHTELLLRGGNLWLSLLWFLLVAILIIFAQAAAWGFLATRMTMWERGLAAVGLIIAVYNWIIPNVSFLPGLGLALLALVGLSQFMKFRRERKIATQ